MPDIQSKPAILVSDANEIYLVGLLRTINLIFPKGKICSAQNTEEIQTLIKNVRFDVMIVEKDFLSLQSADLKFFYKSNPKTKVLATTEHIDVQGIIEFMKQGGSGLLHKNTTKQEILTAIHTILSGKKYFSPDIQEHINIHSIEGRIRSFENNSKHRNKLLKEILFLLINECSTKQIATYLNLSKRTVEKYRSDLLKETGSKNMIGLAVYGLRHNVHLDKSLRSRYKFSEVKEVSTC